MKRTLELLGFLTSCCLWVTSAPAADPKEKKPAQPGSGHEGHHHGDHEGHAHAEHAEHPAPLQPLPEHKVLLEGVGKWKTEQKNYMMGPEPTTSTGTSLVTSILNGLGTAVEAESTGPQGTFKGYGIFTWNTMAKKYEGAWVDIFSFDGMENMEGTYDAATKTFTWTYSWTTPMGKIPCKMIQKTEGPDRMLATFTMTGPDQKEMKVMDVVYTRMK